MQYEQQNYYYYSVTPQLREQNHLEGCQGSLKSAGSQKWNTFNQIIRHLRAQAMYERNNQACCLLRPSRLGYFFNEPIQTLHSILIFSQINKRRQQF